VLTWPVRLSPFARIVASTPGRRLIAFPGRCPDKIPVGNHRPESSCKDLAVHAGSTPFQGRPNNRDMLAGRHIRAAASSQITPRVFFFFHGEKPGGGAKGFKGFSILFWRRFIEYPEIPPHVRHVRRSKYVYRRFGMGHGKWRPILYTPLCLHHVHPSGSWPRLATGCWSHQFKCLQSTLAN